MGPVRRQRAPALSIELLDDQTVFLPGDIILGRVVRRTPTENPNADVSVTLCGHTLSRITITTSDSGGHSHSTHHAAGFTLVDDRRRAQRLATGPLYIPDAEGAEASWPFSIQVPLRVDAAGFAGRPAGGGDDTFVPASPAADDPLPGSYASFGYDVEAAVEYWIGATMELVGRWDKPERVEAVLPITINTVRPGPRLAEYGLRTTTQRAQVATHRLAPGMADAKLSLSQRAQRLFRSSRVPVFAGAVEFSHPTAIQLEDRSPLPVLVRFVPDPYQGSAAVEGRPQRVKLAKLIMTLRGGTLVRSQGAQAMGTESQGRVLLWPPGDKEPAKPFYVPCSDEWPAADIGEHAGLRLGRKGIVGMSSLYPSFTTYLIRRVYEISFEVHLEIAGEITKHKFESSLDVAPPLDTRPYPPTEEPLPPPSFSEALRSPNPGGQGERFGSVAVDGTLTGPDVASSVLSAVTG